MWLSAEITSRLLLTIAAVAMLIMGATKLAEAKKLEALRLVVLVAVEVVAIETLVMITLA